MHRMGEKASKKKTKVDVYINTCSFLIDSLKFIFRECMPQFLEISIYS